MLKLADNIWILNGDGKHQNQIGISYKMKLNIFYCLSYGTKIFIAE